MIQSTSISRNKSIQLLVRYCSTKKPNGKHEYNITNKKLFGPVIKNKEYSKTEVMEFYDKMAKELPKETSKAVDNDISSEIYWQTENTRNKVLPKTIKITKPRNRPPPIQRSLISSIYGETKIPFDGNGLKLILKCPIDRTKANAKETKLIENELSSWPSITKILSATMSESSRIVLKRWKLAKIAELGQAGFDEYQRETFALGTEFHSAVQNYLEKREVPDQGSKVGPLWKSVASELTALEPKPILTETMFAHPQLKYKGIVDSLVEINESIYAVEWKTSEKSKSNLSATFDAPIQLCAYLGALNADSRYKFTTKTGYVVIAYKNGEKADFYRLTEDQVRKYWQQWLLRVQEYWIRTRAGTLPEPI